MRLSRPRGVVILRGWVKPRGVVIGSNNSSSMGIGGTKIAVLSGKCGNHYVTRLLHLFFSIGFPLLAGSSHENGMRCVVVIQ